jgi:hypothetical protein
MNWKARDFLLGCTGKKRNDSLKASHWVCRDATFGTCGLLFIRPLALWERVRVERERKKNTGK